MQAAFYHRPGRAIVLRVRPSPYPKAAYVFICVNRRPASDPLGAGCGEAGEATYAALKTEVARAGLSSSVWTARTYCLGVCPRGGCAAAVSPGGQVVTEVSLADVPALVKLAARGG